MHSRLAAAIFGLGIVDVAYVDFILGPAVLAPASARGAFEVASLGSAAPLDARERPGKGQPVDRALATGQSSADSTAPESTGLIPAPAAQPAQLDAPAAALPSDDVMPSTPGVATAAPTEAQWTVHFPVAGRTGIPEEASDALNQVAERLRQDPSLRVRIVGHTDERGTRAQNWKLGQQRARALARALEAAGASTQQIEVQSEGEDEPAALGSMPEALARNRRAEMAIYAGRSQTP